MDASVRSSSAGRPDVAITTRIEGYEGMLELAASENDCDLVEESGRDLYGKPEAASISTFFVGVLAETRNAFPASLDEESVRPMLAAFFSCRRPRFGESLLHAHVAVQVAIQSPNRTVRVAEKDDFRVIAAEPDPLGGIGAWSIVVWAASEAMSDISCDVELAPVFIGE